jgi:spermidine synthase
LYLTAAFFNENKKNPEVLFLGLGAGSSSYYYNKYFPNYKLTGVEIDGKIVEYGKKYFNLDKYNVKIFVDDARMFLNKTRKKYDIIIVDTFKFPYIPSHLATLEFIELINKRLTKGGVALFNIGRFKKDNDIVKMISQTGLKSFKNAYTYKLSNTSNTFVYFMNHNKDKYYTKIPNIHLQLKVLFHRMGNSLKKVNTDKSIEISTDDKPLTEMLTNKIILKNIREIF